MHGLLAGDIDAAEAMTYNEYAQVLEAVNEETGELYTPEDFNVISYEDVGVGMLQDAIWADGAKLAIRRRLPRHRRAVPRRLDRGLGVLPRQPGVVPRHRRRRRLAARRQPPAVADERGQQAGVAGRERHRLHRPGGVGPDGRDRPEHAGAGGRHGAHRAAERRCLHQRHRHGRPRVARRRRRHQSAPTSRRSRSP